MTFLNHTTITTIGLTLASTVLAEPLTIYTYDSFASDWGPGPAIEEGFEAQCNCDIEFVTAGDGAGLLSRLKLEGDKTNADVVLGLDQNLLATAREDDFFVPHELGDVNIEGANIAWDDALFYPYDWGHFAFVYRKDDMANPPTSLDALADSDLKIVIQDPRVSTPGLGLALWVQDVFKDDAKTYWQRLSDNLVTVTPGWSEAYTLFLDGNADMVLSYTTSPAYHAIAEYDDGFAAARFDEGHPLQIETVAITTASKQADLAREFITYLNSIKGQSALANGNWMFPIKADALPDGFADPSQYETIEPANSVEAVKSARETFRTGLGG